MPPPSAPVHGKGKAPPIAPSTRAGTVHPKPTKEPKKGPSVVPPRALSYEEAIDRIIAQNQPAPLPAPEPPAKPTGKGPTVAALKGLRTKAQKAGAPAGTIERIMEGLTPTESSQRTLKRAQQVMTAVASGKDVPAKLAERAVSILQAAGDRPLRSLPPADRQVVADAFKSAIHAAHTKARMVYDRKVRTADEASKAVVAEISDRHGQYVAPPGKYRERRPGGWFRRKWQGLLDFAGVRQNSPDTASYRLAGDNSTFHRLTHDNIQEGRRREQALYQRAYDYVQAEMAKAGVRFRDIEDWSSSWSRKPKVVRANLPSAVTTDGRRVPYVELTVGERLTLLGANADPDFRARLIRNKQQGFTFYRTRGEPGIKLTAADLKAIVDSATPRERAVLRIMMDVLNRDDLLRGPLNEAWRNEYGVNLTRRESHFPSKRDPIHVQGQRDPSAAMQMWKDRQLSDQGILKRRVGGTTPYVIHDAFDLFYSQMNRVIKYATQDAPIKDALRVLRDPNVITAARRANPRTGEQLLRQIEDGVIQQRGLNVAGDKTDAAVRGLIRNAHVGALGVKPGIYVGQTISIIPALEEMGWRNSRYLNPVLASSKKFGAELRRRSPVMRARHELSSHEILTPGSGREASRQFFGAKSGGLRDLALKPIHAVDEWTIRNIAAVAHGQGKAKGLKGEALWDHVVRTTEHIVNRTQPTYDVLTMSDIHREARESPLKKAVFTMFSSQRNKCWNMAVRGASEYAAGPKDAKAKARLARKIAVPIVIQSAAYYALLEATKGGVSAGWRAVTGGEAKQDDRSKLVRHLFNVVQRAFGTNIFTGEMAAEALNAVRLGLEGPRPWTDAHRPNILTQTAIDMYQGVMLFSDWVRRKLTPKTMSDAAGADRALARALQQLGRGIGPLTGLPVSGVMQLAPELEDVTDTKQRTRPSAPPRK